MEALWSLLMGGVIMGVVLYLTYICTKQLSLKVSKIAGSKYIKIIDKVGLGQDKFIAICKISDKFYLIGITAGNINLLSEIDGFDENDTNFVEKTPEFNSVLSEMMSKIKKKDS